MIYKPGYHVNRSILIHRLHEEIEDFYDYMRPTVEEQRMREMVIKSVEKVVLDLWPFAKVSCISIAISYLEPDMVFSMQHLFNVFIFSLFTGRCFWLLQDRSLSSHKVT